MYNYYNPRLLRSIGIINTTDTSLGSLFVTKKELVMYCTSDKCCSETIYNFDKHRMITKRIMSKTTRCSDNINEKGQCKFCKNYVIYKIEKKK